ncbi:MAG: ATP-binding protein [Nitrospira sp.]|nr:ATP-binding protein [Nitrospira sp.]
MCDIPSGIRATVTMDVLPPDHTILERPFMAYRPFGVDERGERIQDFGGMIIRDNVEYLEECVRKSRGAAAAETVADELCGLLNGRIRDSAYHVTPAFLKTVWNSYSYEFSSYLREFCRQLSGCPTFHYDVGKEKHISPLIQTLGRPFRLSQIHRMYPYFAQKFARGLECTVVEVTDRSAVLRLQFSDKVVEQFGPYRRACAAQTCESSKGRIAMVPVRLHGLPPSTVIDRACIVRGDAYCEWDVRWKPEQSQPVWPYWGATAGLAAFTYLSVVHPEISAVEALAVALVPTLVAGMITSRRIQSETRKREALIQEQVAFVEARHEELREAYLEQEQTRVELRRKVNQLTALHRSGLLFSSTLDREALLQQVLETLIRDLNYDRAMISFYDPVRQVIGNARALGVSPEIQAFVRAREISLTDSESPEGMVVLQGKSLLIGDVREVWDRLHPINQQLIEMINTKALIAVPLKAKDRILGTLMVDRMQEHSLTHDDLELMTTLANQVAIALDNAAAYQQIEEWNMRLEVKVRERTAALEQADRLRSQFLSHVSHELKTPLTSIKGFIQNLLDGLTGPLNDKQFRYLSRMLENSDRLIRMIEDLLDRTRIETGRLEVLPAEVDLEACLADAIEQLRPLAQAKRQKIELVYPAATMIAWADRDRLTQVVVNLVQNSIKFTPEDGQIAVRVQSETPRSARIVVRDTGPGVPSEFLDKIFDPFFRVQHGQRSGPKGLGLGLSIVKTLVELQGGAVMARNHPDGGAEVLFTVPLLPTLDPPASSGLSAGRQILVIEGDADIQQLLADRLRANGLYPHLVMDREMAMERLQAEPYAGVLLEVDAALADRVELVREIRLCNQRIPILLLCTADSQAVAARAMGLGAQATLLKPFESGEVQRLIDYWFRPG